MSCPAPLVERRILISECAGPPYYPLHLKLEIVDTCVALAVTDITKLTMDPQHDRRTEGTKLHLG